MKKEDVIKLADDSYIDLDENEIERYLADFNDVIEYLEPMEKIDTDSVEELTIVNDKRALFRKDVSKEGLSVEDALRNSATTKYSYFEIVEFVE